MKSIFSLLFFCFSLCVFPQTQSTDSTQVESVEEDDLVPPYQGWRFMVKADLLPPISSAFNDFVNLGFAIEVYHPSRLGFQLAVESYFFSNLFDKPGYTYARREERSTRYFLDAKYYLIDKNEPRALYAGLYYTHFNRTVSERYHGGNFGVSGSQGFGDGNFGVGFVGGYHADLVGGLFLDILGRIGPNFHLGHNILRGPNEPVFYLEDVSVLVHFSFMIGYRF